MDLTTLIGIVLGGALIVWGIKPENMGNFIDSSSVAIVVGGTLAAVVASYPLRLLMDIPKHMLVLMRGKNTAFQSW